MVVNFFIPDLKKTTLTWYRYIVKFTTSYVWSKVQGLIGVFKPLAHGGIKTTIHRIVNWIVEWSISGANWIRSVAFSKHQIGSEQHYMQTRHFYPTWKTRVYIYTFYSYLQFPPFFLRNCVFMFKNALIAFSCLIWFIRSVCLRYFCSNV